MQSGEKEGNPAHACEAFMRVNLEGSPYSSMNISFSKAATCLGNFFSRTWRSQGEGGGSSQFLDFSGSYAMVRGCWDIPVSAGMAIPPNLVGVHRHQKMCLCNNKGVRLPVPPYHFMLGFWKVLRTIPWVWLTSDSRFLQPPGSLILEHFPHKWHLTKSLYAFCSVYPFRHHPAFLQVRSYVWA